jgi:hypothetical protein
MNVTPHPKARLGGCNDRRNIGRVTVGDLTKALTSPRTLDREVAPGFRFVPSAVVVQPSISWQCRATKVRAGSIPIPLLAWLLYNGYGVG